MRSASVPPPAAAEALPRLNLRDPDLWLTIVAWGTIVFSALQILLFSFGRDQGIYATVADGLLQGQMPYRDVWDFKPPGIYLVYALAQGLLGKTMLSPRLLEVAGLVGVVFAFMRLSSAFVGVRRVGLLGGALAMLLHAEFEFWHTGQPEAFGGFLTVYALVLTVGDDYTRLGRWLAWVGIGLLFGAAFLLKPPLGGGVLVCGAYLARRYRSPTRSRFAPLLPVLVVGVSSLVPIAAVALWFYSAGAWDALSWTLFEFTPGYTTLSWGGQGAPQMFYHALEMAFFGLSALLAAGLIAAAVVTPMHSREREGVFLILGVVSVHLAGIAMQGKFFPYHYTATVPLLAFLAGIGLYKLWRRCLMGGPGGVLAFMSFLVVSLWMRAPVRDLSSTFWDRSMVRMRFLFSQASFQTQEMLDRELYHVSDYDLAANRSVAMELRRRTGENENVYVWGFEPVVYWLSERAPASRFIYNVPQRATWEQAYARDQLMRDLKSAKPAMIVVQSDDVFPAVTGDYLDSREALAGFPELNQMLYSEYERVRSVEDFVLYARVPDSELTAER